MVYRSFLLILFLTSCSYKSATEKLSNSEVDSVEIGETSFVEEDGLEQRAMQDEVIYNEMDAYNGDYVLYTESEGAEGVLTLKYLGNKVFKFSLKLIVPNICNGVVEDTAYIDRTQHAFYRSDKGVIHFELLGENIEINAEDGCDKMKGECSFSGVYQSITKEE